MEMKSWKLMAGADCVLSMDGAREYNLAEAPDGHKWIEVPFPAGDHVAVPDGAGGYAIANRVRPLEELQAAKRARVDELLVRWFSAGFQPSHPLFAGETLQTRNMEDRTNWLTSQAAYSAQVLAGNGDVLGAVFRTAADATIITSFADGNKVLLEMAGWGAAGMGFSWYLKDAITAQTTVEGVEAIDIDSGWPS